MKFASNEAYSSRSLGNLVWSPDEKWFAISGNCFDLDLFAKMYEKRLGEALERFQDLTRGFDTSDLPTLTTLHDDTSDYTANTSFLSANATILDPMRRRHIAHVANNLAYEWITRVDDDNTVHWNLQRVRDWMRDASELCVLLLFLLHIGGGQPARGPEILTMLYRNLPDTPRGIYLLPTSVTSIIGYTKVCVNH